MIYDVYDVVIVDGGLAGLIAAIVVTRMGIHTVLVESKLLDLPDTKEAHKMRSDFPHTRCARDANER